MRPAALTQVLALASVLALRISGQTPEPYAAPRNTILAKMKDAAVNYAERLQDFLCVELIKRSKEDAGPFKHWQALDAQEREVGYISHQEHYRVLSVNGKPPTVPKIKPGYFLPSGEFGTVLGYIFDPKSAAKFEWDHAEQSGDRRWCVFRYRVTTAESTMILYANGDRVHLRHHGLVYADCDTSMPMRIQIDAEPAAVVQKLSKIALGYEIDVRYALTPIGEKEFLLPQSAEETVRFGSTQTKVEIQFQQCRKYESSSTVTFDADGKQ
jgi:hypothetical protein